MSRTKSRIREKRQGGAQPRPGEGKALKRPGRSIMMKCIVLGSVGIALLAICVLRRERIMEMAGMKHLRSYVEEKQAGEEQVVKLSDTDEFVISYPFSLAPADKIELEEPLRAFGNTVNTKEEKERYLKRYVVAQYRKNNELAASALFTPASYLTTQEKKGKVGREDHPVFEMYNLYVSEKYRGQRLSQRLIELALRHMKHLFGVDDTAIFALHLSPKDKLMEVAYGLYRTSGFTRGAFVAYGPADFRDSYDLLQYMLPVDEVIRSSPFYRKDPSKMVHVKSDTGEKFLALFTTLQEFFAVLAHQPYTKEDYRRHKAVGKELRALLEAQFVYS